jgi:hypothetical protein
MALVFCSDCNEAVADSVDERGRHKAWNYGGRGFCQKHPAPAGPIEPAVAGRCQWGAGHFSAAIWALPKDGKFYCLDHLTRIVRIATWGKR